MNDIPINLDIIEGICQTGNGWSQLDELCASINVPNMSKGNYIKCSNKLAEIQKDIALQLMLEAGAEEKRLAKLQYKIMMSIVKVHPASQLSQALGLKEVMALTTILSRA